VAYLKEKRNVRKSQAVARKGRQYRLRSKTSVQLLIAERKRFPLSKMTTEPSITRRSLQ